MAEFIEVLSDQALKDIDQLINKIDKATKAQKDFNNEAKQYVTPSGASATTQKARRETQKLNEAQKESVRLSRALSRQKAKLEQAQGKVNRELIKLRYETQQTNRLEKQRAIISSRLSTEYQKQQAKINLLTKRYNDLRTKQELGINLSMKEEKELRDVTSQINKKQAALKRVDSAIGKHQRNVGNYSSAWRGVGNVMRTAVAAFGLYSAIDIGRQIFNQVKEINGLNLALKNVTDSTEDYNTAQIFLEQLADRAGVSINNLQRAYIKFFAASKTTNLSLQETQKIFENVTTASAVLGLSTEQTEGALRALEQMLSKGKVQAEEIRGQLGERLPGAFQILADSMGLTTAELSKQLELGNVYADEVLPKFADQLAKAYSLDTINKVETLTAEQNRLGNAWNEFLRSVEGGEGIISKALIRILGTLTQIVSGFEAINQSQNDVQQKNFNKVLKESAERYKELGDEANAYARIDLKREQKEQLRLQQNIARVQEEINSTWSNSAWEISNYKDELKQLNLSYNSNQAQIEAAMKQLGMLTDAKEKDIEKTKEQQELNKTDAVLDGTIAFYEQLISKLKTQQNETATTAKEWQNYQKQIEKAQEALLKLKRAFMGMENQTALDVPLQSEGAMPTASMSTVPVSEMEDYANATDEARKNTEKLLDALQKVADKQLLMSELQGLGDMFGIDVAKIDGFFNEYEDKATAAALTATEVFSGVGQTIFAAEQQRLENQIALNNDYYNNLIQQAQGNEQQQALLRQEQARKERQLRREQAQNEKKSALFEIALNTAAAVVKALPNVPLSIAVGAIGAAKAALVASQPIPQYKTGRQGGKEEFAILGDGYKNEPIVDKDGNLKGMSPNRPTLMHLDQGDSVLPDVNRLNDDVINKTMLYNIQASANQMANQKDQNKGLEKLLAAQGYNIEKSIIKSLKKAKFVNNNNTKVDLGHQFKVNKYKGK